MDLQIHREHSPVPETQSPGRLPCWSSMVPLSRSCWFCCKQCSPTSKSPALTVRQWVGPGSWISISSGCSWPVHHVQKASTKPPTCQRKTAVFPWSQNPTVSEKVGLPCGPAGTVIKKHFQQNLEPDVPSPQAEVLSLHSFLPIGRGRKWETWKFNIFTLCRSDLIRDESEVQ